MLNMPTYLSRFHPKFLLLDETLLMIELQRLSIMRERGKSQKYTLMIAQYGERYATNPVWNDTTVSMQKQLTFICSGHGWLPKRHRTLAVNYTHLNMHGCIYLHNYYHSYMIRVADFLLD